jgi:hypothetical protein
MEVSMSNLLCENYRKETFDTLKLISSESEQLDYQNKVPIAHVYAELFCSWESCYQGVKNRDWYQSTFSKHELAALKRFDITFEKVCSETAQDVPYITDIYSNKAVAYFIKSS